MKKYKIVDLHHNDAWYNLKHKVIGTHIVEDDTNPIVIMKSGVPGWTFVTGGLEDEDFLEATNRSGLEPSEVCFYAVKLEEVTSE